MTIKDEHFLGSDASGSDGGTSRVITLTNTGLTDGNGFLVFKNGLSLALTSEYTVSHASTSTTITFVNALWDSQAIIVHYNQGLASEVSVYCTSAQVFAFLQLGTTTGFSGTDFTSSTIPTKVQVEEWITESEDEINQRTMNSWKSKTITKEYHTIKPPIIRYEGSQIFMENRNITTFDSGSGDKIEVWNGSTWENYLTSRTEGRTNDYWVDEVDGILWLRTYPRILRRTNDVRLTYRFSEPSLPRDIQKACIRLTAITVIQSDDKSILIPEGSQNIPLFEKTSIWQKEADKIIQDNREIKNAIL